MKSETSKKCTDIYFTSLTLNTMAEQALNLVCELEETLDQPEISRRVNGLKYPGQILDMLVNRVYPDINRKLDELTQQIKEFKEIISHGAI